jgi:chromosome partitioning protein
MAARIILVGNEKGGVGKTTLSVHLAAAAASAGRDTLLVDADPGQRSASAWAARRLEAHPDASPVRCVALSGRTVAAELSDLSARYQVIVVDTGAEDSPELRGGATVAHTLVVPVLPDPIDLWTLPTIASIAERARTFNPKLRVILTINRIAHQAAISVPTEVTAWVATNVADLEIRAVIPLVGRAAYGRAIGDGLTVAESGRDPKAAADFNALYDEVFRR